MPKIVSDKDRTIVAKLVRRLINHVQKTYYGINTYPLSLNFIDLFYRRDLIKSSKKASSWEMC